MLYSLLKHYLRAFSPQSPMAAVAYRPHSTPPPLTYQDADMHVPRPPSPASSTSTVTSSRTPDFFRQLHDRQLNCMNTTYMLPADDQEMKRMELEHRMIKFVLNGKNYVGPVAEALTQVQGVQRRVLDCGTGNGLWAIEMADEFQWVQVIGVDLAPVQPRKVPPNCFFELFDLDGQRLPYPDDWFDVVHARSVYTGVQHYGTFVRELARVLKPGGIAIFAEVDSTPFTEKKHRIHPGARGGAPGWTDYWDHVRQAWGQLGIDVGIPPRLRSIARETRGFESVFAQEALVPIGFWPRSPDMLSIGQLAWMNYDSLVLALRPLLLNHGIPPDKVATLIEDAQSDLYHPKIQPSCCWHIVSARKGR